MISGTIWTGGGWPWATVQRERHGPGRKGVSYGICGWLSLPSGLVVKADAGAPRKSGCGAT